MLIEGAACCCECCLLPLLRPNSLELADMATSQKRKLSAEGGGVVVEGVVGSGGRRREKRDGGEKDKVSMGCTRVCFYCCCRCR